MEIKLDVAITPKKTTIKIKPTQSTITILPVTKANMKLALSELYMLLNDHTIISIGRSEVPDTIEKTAFNKIMHFSVPWDVELDYLEQSLINEAKKCGHDLIQTQQTEITIPKNAQKTTTAFKEELLAVLKTFGYSLSLAPEAKNDKPKPAKARHKWTKEVSQIEFTVDTRESKATVFWQKRNEMLLKAGATLMATAPLNKDGSLGFSAKMGQRIREDHVDKIKNNVTTEDIVLKSVNEVGLFLYFGGTNSWLELTDRDGKTINEWTVID
ncbi:MULTISPECIES: hypothetical protein [unclassified Enterococcus]|uniref:hypothetical protein n=1 Tax=unclassified Enterococcus TaxID=2608891 RepID=UPI001CE0494C|nr:MULTISPECIES: hypothetical protein [unclassified Enterococcus]MCA5014463.1 hypothetical protein [Enterococcus sp. S23]MCA5017423.1 hypothetical protein [Enterococcus sp. S22(2020)]